MKPTKSLNITKSQVVSFQSFSLKRKEQEHLARGRQPLYVSHSRSSINSGLEPSGTKVISDFGDRISQMRQKIKNIDDFVNKLNRINQL